MTEWQPIETCPKDEWVLVCEPGWHLMVAKWIYDDQWRYAKDADGVYLSCRPTHWMMLPMCPADWEGEWGKSNYVNPPFGSIVHQGKKKGPTAWGFIFRFL